MGKFGTFVGVFGATAVVIISMYLEGSHIGSFLNLSAFNLIMGGTMCVVMTCFGMGEIPKLPKYMGQAFFPPQHDLKHVITEILSFSEKARREGLLALEDDVHNVKDDMTRTGLQMIVDGAEPETTAQVLEDFDSSAKKHEKIPAEVFETLGGFAPTLGIIGTVMGLVHVLEGLGGGGGIEQLGEGIAVAFIATFYGIGFANILWLPLSNRIKTNMHHAATSRGIVTTGILAIQAGENPRVLKDKLLAQIGDPAERKKINEELKM